MVLTRCHLANGCGRAPRGRTSDTGHTGTISVTIRGAPRPQNAMKPRFQRVLTRWKPGSTASGTRASSHDHHKLKWLNAGPRATCAPRPSRSPRPAVQARQDRGRPYRPATITGTDHTAVDVLICRILLSSSAPPDAERRTTRNRNQPAWLRSPIRLACGLTSELPQAITTSFCENLPARTVILPRFPVSGGQRELFQDQRRPIHTPG